MKYSSLVGNLNTIDLTEPMTTVTGTTTAKGTVVDAVIKLYTLDHSYKYISVSQVGINKSIKFVLACIYDKFQIFNFFFCLENYGQ